jgi:hypothetical protein
MALPDLKPEFEELISAISKRNGYYGNKIPASIMKMFEVVISENGGGILVPYWISVLQKGRGPRKSTKDHGLWKILYRWMDKKNMFESASAEGKINEAKRMTWWINKHGNQHFQSGVFVDVFESERKKTIEKINKKFVLAISKITMDII